jgi:hypothetical protein
MHQKLIYICDVPILDPFILQALQQWWSMSGRYAKAS